MLNESERSLNEDSDPAGNLDGILAKADVALHAGDESHAQSLYVRASEIDDRSVAAWTGRARTAKDVDEAIRSWSKATILDPQSRVAQSALDECIQKRIDTAIIETAPALVSLAKIVAEAGHKSNAYALARRATELAPGLEDAWVWRGGLTDDPREMTDCLGHALSLNPKNRQAKDGLEWSQTHKATTSASVEPKALESSKKLEEGQEVLKRGDKARAQELFRKATELNEKNEQAWLWRGSTTPNIDEAVTCIEQAIAINPNNETAREALSWLRVKKLRGSAQGSPAPAPATPPANAKTRGTRRGRRLARIIPLAFVVLALLILVLALLYSRGFWSY